MPWAEIRAVATAVMLFVAMAMAFRMGLHSRTGVVLLVLLSLVWLTGQTSDAGPVRHEQVGGSAAEAVSDVDPTSECGGVSVWALLSEMM